MPQYHPTISVFEDINCENCIFSRIEDDETIVCCGREHFVVCKPDDFCSQGRWIYLDRVSVPPLPAEPCGYTYLYQHIPDKATLEDILKEREEDKKK